MSTALLLIAHGSRQENANADLHHVAEALRRRGEYTIVEAAFLELAAPDISTGAAACVERGAERVILVPYFLSAGVHVQRDLQGCRDRFSRQFAPVEFLLAEPLGRHELLVEITAQRAREADAR